MLGFVSSPSARHTNIPRGSLDVYDMGWGAADWNDLTDENGTWWVETGQPTNTRNRGGWMATGVHQEEASITLSITSGWGVYSTTFAAPTTPTATVEVALPFVDVTAVTPEIAEGVVNAAFQGWSPWPTPARPPPRPSAFGATRAKNSPTPRKSPSALHPARKRTCLHVVRYTAGEAACDLQASPPTALNDITEDVVDLTGRHRPPSCGNTLRRWKKHRLSSTLLWPLGSWRWRCSWPLNTQEREGLRNLH
ncbi:MAG: hypothetical protein CM15mP78_03980 [Candidatus Poseidoniales archaeon]|nr:MAG: hypothetical protein CM15mP78_03980 [Candidatus Poseidoniales archaeon]